MLNGWIDEEHSERENSSSRILHVSALLAPPPRATTAKHHRPGGLKQQKFVLSHYSSGGRKSKESSSLCSLWWLEGRICPGPFPLLLVLSTVLVLLGSWMHPCNLCLGTGVSLHVWGCTGQSSLSVHLSLCLCSSSTDNSHIG